MNKESISGIVKQKKGAALLTVLVIFFTLLVVVTSLLMVTESNVRSTAKTANFSSAFYVAETGINEFVEVIDELVSNTPIQSNCDLLCLFNEKVNELQLNSNNFKVNASKLNGNNVQFEKEYGTVMGSVASVNIELKMEEGNNQYSLTSTGVLGNSSRTVSKSFELIGDSDSESGGETEIPNTENTVFNSNGIVAIDRNNIGLSPFQFADNQVIHGPIITNRDMIFTESWKTIIRSAFVTSGEIDFSRQNQWGGTPWASVEIEDVLITSGKLTINMANSSSIKTIIVKEGGKINVDIRTWNFNFDFSYVLIPDEYKSNITDIINYNRSTEAPFSTSKIVYEEILSKLIFYKQIDFDPWNSSHYSFYEESKYNIVNIESVINDIFGNDPSIDSTSLDYRQYFTKDFILDNLDNQEITDSFFPNTSIPEAPLTSEETKYNQGSGPIMVGSSNQFVLVNAQNEFNYSASISNDGSFHTLDLSQGNQTVYSFESFILEEHRNYDNALTINVGNKEVSIVTKSLNILNSSLKILGSGTLNIYVTGNNGIINIRETWETNPRSDLTLQIIKVGTYNNIGELSSNDVTKLKIFVTGLAGSQNNNLKIGTGNGSASSAEVYASIYTRNMNAVFESRFFGVFISIEGTSVSRSDQGQQIISPLIYAPNATLNITGTGLIKGNFIINSIDANASASRGEFSFNYKVEGDLIQKILEPILNNTTNTNRSGGPTIPSIPGESRTTGLFTIVWGPTIEVGGR